MRTPRSDTEVVKRISAYLATTSEERRAWVTGASGLEQRV